MRSIHDSQVRHPPFGHLKNRRIKMTAIMLSFSAVAAVSVHFFLSVMDRQTSSEMTLIAKSPRQPSGVSNNLTGNNLEAGSILDIDLSDNAVLSIAYCPAGTFTMGSPAAEEGRLCDEEPVEVKLTEGFWMAKTEITQIQWKSVIGSNPSHFVGDDLPVENVSWAEAHEFIDKLNDLGVAPAAWKFVLPSEAQWEYACRSGHQGPFSGGSLDEIAWYGLNSQEKTHTAGTKKPNPWGLHDMHGNVWEWCEDWYATQVSGGIDPIGPESANYRVFRGGSWINSMPVDCRAAHRRKSPQTSRYNILGFRVAMIQK